MMISKNSYKFLVIFFLFLTTAGWAQNSVSGVVKATNGQPLQNAHVSLFPTKFSTITDSKGSFVFKNIANGEYKITITYLGTAKHHKKINVDGSVSLSITLEQDPLNLNNVVVTGSFDPQIQLQSSTAVTTLTTKDIKKIFPRGTASMLQNVPGTFTDASAGEVFTKVYTRGISASAEDDMGWYYVSLEEDGLPVSLVQHSYYGPDIFFRNDLTIQKVEALRGGKAAITSLNAPGGIFNFISRTGSDKFGGELQLNGGQQGDNNSLYRIDGFLGGSLGDNLFFTIGGHYRSDDGARNTNFTFSHGGQLKFNLLKKGKNGFFKFYGKYLDDYTNRYTGVAATDWKDPKAAFGQDFGTTALMLPAFDGRIPDSRNLADEGTRNFDPSNGVHAKEVAFGTNIEQGIGSDWKMNFDLKFSFKNALWQTSISNAFVSLSDPTAYFISGAGFPIGQVVFKDANSGEEIARVDNSGILGGQPFQYLNAGTLPNDAIMGVATWDKGNAANEVMNKFMLSKKTDDNYFSIGMASGFSSTSLRTQGSFGYATYEPSARMMRVTIENPGSPVQYLSDSNGVSNYGGLFFGDSRANVSQIGFFTNERWSITDNFDLEAGLRYEIIKHNGSNDRSKPFEKTGGFDGNQNTLYDNGVLMSSGVQDKFNFKYDYLSASIGLNYSLNNAMSIFARFSKGNKAPEMNYYFNNFTNVPIDKKGEVQEIRQGELGLKWHSKHFSVATTAFWSQLKNIGVSDFVFDDNTNNVFYAPVQFNDSRTIGLEWEAAYTPTLDLTFRFNGVLQDPKATKWDVYDAAGSIDTADDTVTSYADNTLPFNPKMMLNMSAEYQRNNFDAFVKWNFMGEREGNVANAFQLASYSIFDAGVGFSFTKNISVNALVTNIFDSEGLANFFGANSFGASANGATSDFIQANPDASFIVVPVLPRGIVLGVNYKF